MLDLARMFGNFSGLQTQHPQYVQSPMQQQQMPDPSTGRQRRMQRLSDRMLRRPFGKGGGQNGQVTQDLQPIQQQEQPMDMMDDPFVSEGWNGPSSTYNPMNLGAMLGRRNFF